MEKRIKISILTTTVRPRGLQLVSKAISDQDFEDFEWIISASEKYIDEIREVLGNVDYKLIVLPPKKEWQVWDLNYAYNRMIELSSGELLVSWQDYTYADKNLLSTLWSHYQEDPIALVSVCGNKYPDDDFDIPAWIDPRYSRDEYNWQDLEWNLLSVPRKIMCDIGGFDEIGMDKFFGLDGYSVNHRLADAKIVHFKLEKGTKTYSLFHGRDKDWDKKNGLGTGKAEPYEARVAELKLQGSWPYLDNNNRKLR